MTIVNGLHNYYGHACEFVSILKLNDICILTASRAALKVPMPFSNDCSNCLFPIRKAKKDGNQSISNFGSSVYV